jgi:Iron-containing redox enzyme
VLAPSTEAALEHSNSRLIRLRVELGFPLLRAAASRLVTHPEWRRLYPLYLQWLHGAVRASVPLMQMALDRAEALSGRDSVASRLAMYLRGHIPEEVGHDAWLLEDMREIGLDTELFLQGLTPPSVAALVGSQYYWVLHEHPVALLGYVFVLEGYPPSTEQVDDHVRTTGYPARAFRTLREHAEIDGHHKRELDRALDEMPLSPRQLSIIGLSALTTVDLYANAVTALVDDFDKKKRRRSVRPRRLV